MNPVPSTRTFTRVPVHIEAEARGTSGRITRGRVLDISLSGLSVEADGSLPAGEPCTIDLLLSESGDGISIRLTGQVVRWLDGVLAFAVDSIDPSGYEHFMNLLLYNAPSARAFEEEMETKADLQPSVAPTGKVEGPLG